MLEGLRLTLRQDSRVLVIGDLLPYQVLISASALRGYGQYRAGRRWK